MPIGNQQVWDKGIGDPATNMLMQSVQNSGPSGFNPNALTQQPVQQQAQQQSQQKYYIDGREVSYDEWLIHNQQQQGQQWTQAMRAGPNGGVEVGEDPTKTGNFVPYGGTYGGPWSTL